MTDLFPPSATRGKQVLIIYKGSTNDEYLALKREKSQLVQTGKYTGEPREQIARKLGRLLSYPDAEIDRALKTQAQRRAAPGSGRDHSGGADRTPATQVSR